MCINIDFDIKKKFERKFVLNNTGQNCQKYLIYT